MQLTLVHHNEVNPRFYLKFTYFSTYVLSLFQEDEIFLSLMWFLTKVMCVFYFLEVGKTKNALFKGPKKKNTASTLDFHLCPSNHSSPAQR